MPNKNFLSNPPTFSLEDIITARPGQRQICYLINATTDQGMWTDINPLSKKLPMFIMQLILVTGVTRILLLAARPLRQPRFAAEYWAGLILGPSVIAVLPHFLAVPIDNFIFKTVFAVPRRMMMETVANLGMLYHLFFLGLEMDLTALTRVGNKALSIGISGSLLSFLVGAVFYYFGFPRYREDFSMGCMFWGVVLSVTGLQPVGDLLINHKLLHSEFGRVGLSSALVSGIVSWILLLICATITASGEMFFLSIIMAVLVAVFLCYAVRPSILWMIKKTQDGEEFSESTVCITLTMVLFCGLLTDVCGLSSMYGAFMLGLIIPKEALGHRFLMVLQGFVSDLLLPLYFCSVGMRARFLINHGAKDFLLIVQVTVLSYLPKITTALAVAYLYKMPVKEGIALGVLMNVKGVVAPLGLVWGRDHLALSSHGYDMMVIPIGILTTVASPVIGFLYKPKKLFIPSKHRALQKLKPDAELRVLACIHELQSVPGITALLEATNATRRSPVCLFALQLIRLAKHTTALLIEHGPQTGGPHSSQRIDGQTDKMIAAFQKLEDEKNLISVQILTAMSDYTTMHEDVCSIAEEKRVTLIILPFHKRQTVHNRMEDVNPVYKEINDNILAKSPCSVCILVDRGFSLFSNKGMEGGVDTVQIGMIYIGGRDDREALTFALRMAGKSNGSLTVIRFIPDSSSCLIHDDDHDEDDLVRVDVGTEKQLDDDVINDFRQKTEEKESVNYVEKESNNGAETVAVLKTFAESFDIFVVGRGFGMTSRFTAGLEDWSEYPELGSIGDLLISSDFPSTTSVLVVQQYAGVMSGKKTHEESSSCRVLGHIKADIFGR